MSRDVAPCRAPCKKFYPSHVFTRLPSPSPFRNDANAAEMLEKVAVETRSGKRGDMARIVMKFGGTSMAGTERIRTVARLVAREVANGHEVAGVVSALAAETARLVHFCPRGTHTGSAAVEERVWQYLYTWG